MTPQSFYSLKHHTHTHSLQQEFGLSGIPIVPSSAVFPRTEAEMRIWGWADGARDDGVHNGRMTSERRCWLEACITDLSTCAGSQPMNRMAALGFQRCWISQNKRQKPANIPLALVVTSPNPLYTLKCTCKESDLMSTIFQSRLNQSVAAIWKLYYSHLLTVKNIYSCHYELKWLLFF